MSGRLSQDLYRRLDRLLNEGERVALATVLAVSGSAPRAPGAKMLACGKGEIAGTIGGGLLEAQVISLAEKLLRKGGAALHSFSLASPRPSDTGMLCGGRVEVLVEILDGADPSTRRLFRELCREMEKKEEIRLVTLLGGPDDSLITRKGLVKDGKLIAGNLEPSSLIMEVLGETAGIRPALVTRDGNRIFVEALGRMPAVYVFGAGHIAQCLVPLCSLAGFDTTVLDERAEFANKKRFPTADRILLLESFGNAPADLNIDQNTFLVIITPDGDKAVLTQILRTDSAYIGMIGSRRKWAIFRSSLHEEGFSEEELDRVHCPIGLPIDAESPQEIAFSIVAELIKVRATRKGPCPPASAP